MQSGGKLAQSVNLGVYLLFFVHPNKNNILANPIHLNQKLIYSDPSP